MSDLINIADINDASDAIVFWSTHFCSSDLDGPTSVETVSSAYESMPEQVLIDMDRYVQNGVNEAAVILAPRMHGMPLAERRAMITSVWASVVESRNEAGEEILDSLATIVGLEIVSALHIYALALPGADAEAGERLDVYFDDHLGYPVWHVDAGVLLDVVDTSNGSETADSLREQALREAIDFGHEEFGDAFYGARAVPLRAMHQARVLIK